MSTKAKSKEISRKASAIAQMITWFDGYTELHIVDPLRIERLLKSRVWSDLDQIWKGVRDDVSAITDLPASSERVKKFSRMSSFARLASVIMVVISFGFLEFYFFNSNIKKLVSPTIAVAVIIVVMYLSLMVSVLSSRRMNAAIRQVYQEHEAELSKNRRQIRQTTQTLIDILQQDVASHDLDPTRYKFKIFSTKYRNINVIDGREPRHSASVRGRISRNK